MIRWLQFVCRVKLIFKGQRLSVLICLTMSCSLQTQDKLPGNKRKCCVVIGQLMVNTELWLVTHLSIFSSVVKKTSLTIAASQSLSVSAVLNQPTNKILLTMLKLENFILKIIKYWLFFSCVRLLRWNNSSILIYSTFKNSRYSYPGVHASNLTQLDLTFLWRQVPK